MILPLKDTRTGEEWLTTVDKPEPAQPTITQHIPVRYVPLVHPGSHT